MIYRTIVEPGNYGFEISHQSNLMLLGSCFSENIGDKLKAGKFNVQINPFGILFNPKSIKETLVSIVNERNFLETDLIQENGLFHSFSHHGKFSATSAAEVLEHINEERKVATEHLKKTDVLIITLGSAWVYRHQRSNQIVANCHKISNKEFKKELLGVDTIVSDFQEIIKKIKTINPALKIIFTISPVRHWKDGPENNNLSKSILNVAIHELVKMVEGVYYFPAYEMVIDDLRDYRFYKDDMLHPNSIAIDYVWEGVKSSFFDEKTLLLLAKIEKIKSALNHRAFNSESGVHQSFLAKQIQILKDLEKQNLNLDFEEELLNFKNQLI